MARKSLEEFPEAGERLFKVSIQLDQAGISSWTRNAPFSFIASGPGFSATFSNSNGYCFRLLFPFQLLWSALLQLQNLQNVRRSRALEISAHAGVQKR